MLSPRIIRPQPRHGTASAGSSSSRRHMVDASNALNARGSVPEWEVGLPSAAELTPVSQPLIPPALAAAFGIGPADAFPPPVDARFLHDSPTSHLSSSRFDDDDDDEEGEGETEDAATGGKKARMVWTPSLHHRFVEAVERLGDKGAVPKAIVRLMNVDGLTRENVASHLQKYRLYLKRSRAHGGAATATATQPPQMPPPSPPYFPRFAAQPPRDGYCPFVSYEKLGCD